MPNQRSKNKTYLGGYIDKTLHAEIVKRAKAEGMENNKFGFVTLLLQKAVRRQGRGVAGRDVTRAKEKS